MRGRVDFAAGSTDTQSPADAPGPGLIDADLIRHGQQTARRNPVLGRLRSFHF